MSQSEAQPEAQPEARPVSAVSRRATLILMVVAISCVLLPFLFWRGTWFGLTLSEKEIRQYLEAADEPRKAQHALVQISEQMAAAEAGAKLWYPSVLELTRHPLPELRVTAAWVMGQDRREQRFHDRLREMIEDPDPLVRRNATLSLAGFEDAAARPVLLAMLRPFTVKSLYDGMLTNRLEAGDLVDQGTLLARIAEPDKEEPSELRSPVPGTVVRRLLSDGVSVQAGDEVMVLSPSSDHVYEALRALFLIGTLEDLEDVQRFRRPREDMPVEIAQQAELTAAEIRRRSNEPGTASQPETGETL